MYFQMNRNVIASHPKVLEVASHWCSGAKSGEVIKVFSVKKDQSLTEEELKNIVMKISPIIKCEYFVFRTELQNQRCKFCEDLKKEEEAVKAA